MLVQQEREARLIVLIYTITHPIHWVRNSVHTDRRCPRNASEKVDVIETHSELCYRDIKKGRGQGGDEVPLGQL